MELHCFCGLPGPHIQGHYPMEMRICGESQQITLPAWASCAPNHSVHRGRPHEWATESPGLHWVFRGGKWWMRLGKIWWYNLVGGFYHLEKYERQWEGFSHILWKIKNVWSHQPVLNIWWGYHGDKWSYSTWVYLKMGIWWVSSIWPRINGNRMRIWAGCNQQEFLWGW